MDYFLLCSLPVYHCSQHKWQSPDKARCKAHSPSMLPHQRPQVDGILLNWFAGTSLIQRGGRTQRKSHNLCIVLQWYGEYHAESEFDPGPTVGAKISWLLLKFWWAHLRNCWYYRVAIMAKCPLFIQKMKHSSEYFFYTTVGYKSHCSLRPDKIQSIGGILLWQLARIFIMLIMGDNHDM